MTLLLERIAFGIGRAVDFDLFGLNFDRLSRAEAFDQRSVDAEAGSRSDVFQHGFVEAGHIDHDLYVVDGRAVIEGDERHVFVSPFGADPSLDGYFGTFQVPFQQIDDFCSASVEHMMFS